MCADLEGGRAASGGGSGPRALRGDARGPNLPGCSGAEHAELTASAVALATATAPGALATHAHPRLEPLALAQLAHQRVVGEHAPGSRRRASAHAAALARPASHALARAARALATLAAPLLASELAVQLACLSAGDLTRAAQGAHAASAHGRASHRATSPTGRALATATGRARLALATSTTHPGGLVLEGDRSIGTRALGEEVPIVAAVAGSGSRTATARLSAGSTTGLLASTFSALHLAPELLLTVSPIARASARGGATHTGFALAAASSHRGGLVLEPHGAVHRPYGIRGERPPVLVDQNRAHDRFSFCVGVSVGGGRPR